jgi:hypothetical protein
MRYRVKVTGQVENVVEVDAFQWQGDNAQEIVDLTDGGIGEINGSKLTIRDAGGGTMAVLELGEWLLRPTGPSHGVYVKSDRDLRFNYDRVSA